jgi:DNA-binding CsgD family transcriptional regulator
MSDCLETGSPHALRRDRSIASRRKVRQTKADRERRIMNLLNAGGSAADIARLEGLSLKRVRNLVREILAQRMPQPPAEFVALQVSRLSEALLVSYTAMYGASTGANFQAIDRVVRIVRELDRYHGYVPLEAPTRADDPRLAPPPSPLALEAPLAERLGNGAASD